ncbi:MAG TPA: response regulator [Candidatus Dormibacteraeota bacterium]|nr:response regulator [Candidatus Dormibacteraeota bacterium]
MPPAPRPAATRADTPAAALAPAATNRPAAASPTPAATSRTATAAPAPAPAKSARSAAPAPAPAPPPPAKPQRRQQPSAPARPAPELVLQGRHDPKPAPAPRAPHEATNGHILLVEDDDTIATMYLMLLGTKGYTTRHARDGVDGIEMVRAQRPALILLDMLMPRMDGIEFLQVLRDAPKTCDVPVVVLSNVADRALVDRALALGCVEYLVKAQTRPQVLLGALPHWLRGNRALTVSA